MSLTGKILPEVIKIKQYNRGDIVLIDFGKPNRGHEQEGPRPALVISNKILNQTGIYYVVPITSTHKDFPTRIALDERTITHGDILTDQIRAVDLNDRKPKVKEVCPDDILLDVVETIKELLSDI